MSRFLITLTVLAVFWPWVAAGTLASALLFLPGSVVQKAWALPLYTTLAIPVTTVATLVAGRSLLPNTSSVPAV